jgi:protein transport protein SEC31
VVLYRFNDIAWAESDDNTRGVIAGALNSGSLDLWDADKLLIGARSVVGRRRDVPSSNILIATLKFQE